MAGGHKQTFTGRHLVNVRLTGPGSEKDTRHHEIAIEDPAVSYLPGDALGLHASNDPALVERVIAALSAEGDQSVVCSDGSAVPLGRALTEIFNLNTPSRRLIELLVSRGAA